MEARIIADSPLPESPTPGGARRNGKLILAALAIGTVLAGGWVAFARKPYSELPLYLRAGERMLQGEPIYRSTERAFTYPPLFAVPFVYLTLLPAWSHRLVWYLVNCAALAVILCSLQRRLLPALTSAGESRPLLDWLFWPLVALLAGRHVLSPLENQSHDLLVFLCVMLAIDASCAGRERAAGFGAGLGAALKATPLLFAPIFLWQRRFVAVLVLLITLAAFMVLPDLLFPAQDSNSWTVAWYQVFLSSVQPGESASSAAWKQWNQLNQSLAGTVYRLFTPLLYPEPDQFDVCLIELSPLALKAVTLASQLAVMAGLFWVTRRRITDSLPEGERAFLKLGEGAALVTAMVLLSPTSIKTHFCVLLVPVAFCLADFLYRRRDVVVGSALIVSFVLGTLTVKGVLGRTVGDRVMTYGSVTACALALFLATGRVLLQRGREAQAALGREAVLLKPQTEQTRRALPRSA